MALTLRQLLSKSSPKVTFHPNMSAQQLVDTWKRVPGAIKALIPELNVAMTTLETALTVLKTYRKVYETAKTTLETLKKTVIKAAAALSTPPYAAAESSSDATQLQNKAQNAAMQAALTKVKNYILDYPIPGT